MNFRNLNIDKSLSFILICLIPIFLITGPFLSDLALVIISLIFIYNTINKKLFDYYNEKFVYIFIFFFIIILLSAILSENFIFSIKKTLSYTRYLFFSLAILFVIRNSKNFLFIFSKIFIYIYIVVLLDGYFQFIFGFNIIGMVTPNNFRLSGFFGDELVLGSYLSRYMPILVFSMFYQKYDSRIIIILSFVSTLLIFLTGERLAFVFAILMNLYLIIQIKDFRFYGFFCLFILIIFSTYLYTNNNKINTRLNQTFGELGISNIFKPGYSIGYYSQNDKEKKIFQGFNFFSPMHENYLYTSLKMFYDKPIFGHGPNTYRIYCLDKKYNIDKLSCSTHPHNTYAQLLAEIGIFGFFYIFFIFLYFFFISIRHFFYLSTNTSNNKYILNKYEISLIPSFLMTLLPLVPSGNFFNNWLGVIYFFPVGFYLSIKYWKKN